jgi:hypothetical protein
MLQGETLTYTGADAPAVMVAQAWQFAAAFEAAEKKSREGT